jgi:transposase
MAIVSRAELIAAIRRDARDGLSNRQIQRKYGVGYRTVKQALASAWPAERKEYTPRGSKLEPFKPIIDAILVADLDAPRKQRHTLTRIYQRLIDEHGMTDVSYPVVGRYVRKRRPEILAVTGRAPAKVFIPQTHRPGEEADSDAR